MSSIFSKIVKGEIPCHKVAENDRFLAFMDIRPLVKGHVLAIPKQEIDYIFDLDDALLADLMVFAKGVGKAIEEVVSCIRIGIMVVGLEVRHAHIHLIPMNEEKDICITKKPLSMSHDALADLAAQIRESYQAQNG